MRKTLVLSVLACICSTWLFAQTPTYNTGTAGNSANSFPFSAGPSGSNRVQWMYLPNMLNSPSGLITDVYFRTGGTTGSLTMTGLIIKMGYTSSSTWPVSTAFDPNTTDVLNASTYTTVAIAGTYWMKFTLQTPFLYDNTKNLLVDVQATSANTTVYQVSTGPSGRVWGNYLSGATGSGAGLVDFGFDLLPKIGYNNAALYSIATPTPPFCPGTQNIAVKVKNAGNNRINSVQVNWVMDGIPQTPVTYNNLIDTINGSQPNIVTVNLGSALFAGSPHSFKFYTSMPNGIVDTSTKDDTLYKTLGPSPTAVITPVGTTIFCTAGVINAVLNAPTGVGNAYQWKLNGSPLPGAIGSSWTATQAGDYSVQIDSNGCTNTSATIRVDNLAMPMPVVHPSGFPVLCTGDSITMTANAGVTGATYQWKFQGNDIIGATSTSFVAYNPGNYSVVTSKLVCNATSQGINVVPKTRPLITITDSLSISKPMHILSVDPTLSTYQWHVSNGATPPAFSPINGETQFVFIAKENGDYMVVGNNGGCDGFSDTVHITDLGTGIRGINGNQNVSIYPNPVNNTLHVNAPEKSNIIISSIDGKILINKKLTTGYINVSELSEGSYIVRITNDNDVTLKVDKLIKVK